MIVRKNYCLHTEFEFGHVYSSSETNLFQAVLYNFNASNLLKENAIFKAAKESVI